MSSATFELKPHIVRAGAGAGKTRSLTEQVLKVVDKFVREEARFPHLVVTTFTRKATQELRERLMQEAIRRQNHELLQYISSKSFLSVSTIHGVLSQFLTRFATYINIDPAFQILSDSELQKVSKKTLRDVLLATPNHQELLETYGFNQLLQFCLRYYEAKGAHPSLRFYQKNDFEQFSRNLIQDLQRRLKSIAAQILHESTHPSWMEFATRLQTMEQSQFQNWSEMRSAIILLLEQTGKKPSQTAKNPAVSSQTDESVRELWEDLKRFRHPEFDPQSWPQWWRFADKFQPLADEFVDQVKKAKYTQGLLQMGDLELATLELIRAQPMFAETFSQEWDYWLIDEYQDTSPIQVEILRHLIGAKAYFIVGDPQQSIYLFRGARREVFANGEKSILQNGGTRAELLRNYRSRPELLLFFNHLFCAMGPQFQPMEANIPADQKIDSSAIVAKFIIADADADEKSAIVTHALKLLRQGARPEDICVLARTNQQLAQVALALSMAGVHSHVHAATGFYDRREIQDALSFLKFLVNPHDNRNLTELLRSPWFRVPDDELVRSAQPKSSSLWTILRRTQNRAVEKLARYLTLSQMEGISQAFLRALVDEGYIDFSHHHDTTGRREANLWKLVTQLFSEQRQPGFQYLEFIEASQGDLRESEGMDQADAVSALEPNRINLMTVHAAKGLQFNHVIVPFMGQASRTSNGVRLVIDEENAIGSLPVPVGDEQTISHSILGQAQIKKMREREAEESERVLYVALTRARESVFLSWSGKPEKGSWASRIQMDLSPGGHRTDDFSYEVDTGPWEFKIQVQKVLTLNEIRPAFRATTAVATKTQSVSELLQKKSRVRLRQILPRMQSSTEGILAHRLFEILKYQRDPDWTQLIQRSFPGREAELLEALRYVRDLRAPPMKQILETGFAEWSFVYYHKQIRLEGQIDLWGYGEGDKVWIVDYKTGQQHQLESAFDQLNLYSLALRGANIFPEYRAIQLAVVFPFQQKSLIREAKAISDIERQFW